MLVNCVNRVAGYVIECYSLWQIIYRYRSTLEIQCYLNLQACPIRTSDVRDYRILVPDLSLLSLTSPKDLPGHISDATKPTKKYDLSIYIYIS